ncbi:DUF488 domain-containing protein [Acinetobacter rongchengensis]|uniref:DUF488 family protein n=1 Tax=Acinetobacter rongchengensis TaxID=2419601 RepID=A0A3A8EU73_9GAMM|nr:DUF488 family protein [Acinetobacter rongchengensis]RKG38422.1 DUF488 family protein [Acinetobacter rongchengensis]
MSIQTKRVYDAVSASDGKRVLVDRLWPRGIKKELAQIDWWPKEITPSNELRKWYHEDMENRWEEFEQKYRAELSDATTVLNTLRDMIQKESVTLISAVKNIDHSHVTVLIDIL